jgi:anti-sigma regulatory factor (Ser/Thr protein kinase)
MDLHHDKATVQLCTQVNLARHGTAGDQPPYAAVAASHHRPAGRAIPLSGSSMSRHMLLSALDDHSACWQLSWDPVQVRHARDQARKALFGWALGEHAELPALIVSELVTNAVCHGEGPVWVRLSAGGGDLRVEVHDSGGGRPVRGHSGGGDECGRGVELLDGLIWLHGGERGVTGDPAGPGKTVSVVLSLQTAGAGAR